MSSPESFYIAGGSMHANAPSYVVRRADTQLYEGLCRGEFCYVLTPRQMGKSSLMVRAAVRLRAKGIRAAVLDLTALGHSLEPRQWYCGLLDRLGEQLCLEDELESFWLSHPGLGPLQRFFEAIHHVALPASPEPLVIFIDEIDAVRSLPFPTDELFAAIRECHNRRSRDPEHERLTFCLLGTAAPSDLVQDTRITPFNIGRRIELTDFTPDEAAPLARGLGADAGRGLRLLRAILHWTGGHPCLTQRLCRAVALDPGVRTPRGVARLCRAMFLSPTARDRDDNLVFVRDRLLRGDHDVAALLDLYRRVLRGQPVADSDTDALVSLLRLSGLVRPDGGRLTLRNRIYARVFDGRWVRESMPGAEVRRQRAAYRRGVLRAAGVAGAVVVVMAVLAAVAASFARRADESRREADRRTAQAQAFARERDRVYGALVQSNRDKDSALKQLEDAVWAEKAGAEEARKAVDALRRERDHVRQQERRADAAVRAGRERLVRLTVMNGVRALDDEDAGGALLWFVQALKLDEGRPDRESVDRIRIGMLLGRSALRGTDPARARTLPYHTTCAYFSPDGRRIVAGTGSGEAHIWDVSAWREACPPLRHGSGVEEAAFSPDGTRVATAGLDGRACIWDAGTGRLLLSLPHPDRAWSVAFSADGRWLATTTPEGAHAWDLTTGRLLRTFPSRGAVTSGAAFSPDSRRLLTWDKSGTARVFDLVTGQQTAALRHVKEISAAEFSPDGSRVVTASFDRTACIWDAATGRRLGAPMRLSDDVRHACFSPDGRRVATASGSNEFESAREARVWDAATGLPITPPLLHGAGVRHVRFSQDGRLLVTGCRDHTVRLWDPATGEPVTQPLRTSADVYYADIDRGSRHVLAAANDGTVWVWDIAPTGRPSHELMAMAVAMSGRRFDLRGDLRLVDPSVIPMGGRAPGEMRAAGVAPHPRRSEESIVRPAGCWATGETPQQAQDRIRARLWELEKPYHGRAGSSVAQAAKVEGTHTTRYDEVARDFSVTRNPNGRWTYGCARPGGPFTPYSRAVATESGGGAWRMASVQDPSVYHNGTGAAIVRSGGRLQFPAGSVSLGPAVDDRGPLSSVVRWTAPAPGEYLIAAAFYGLDDWPTSTRIHIAAGGRPILDSSVIGVGTQNARLFCRAVVLGAGAHVDFVVGVGLDGGMDRDTTALEARITRLDATTRPRP